MDKQTFENDINAINAELNEAKEEADSYELKLIGAKARVRDLNRNLSALTSWGVARGFVAKADLLPAVTQVLSDVPMTSKQIADALDAEVRAVTGALRRGVGKGLIVPTDEGYIMAVPDETPEPIADDAVAA